MLDLRRTPERSDRALHRSSSRTSAAWEYRWAPRCGKNRANAAGIVANVNLRGAGPVRSSGQVQRAVTEAAADMLQVRCEMRIGVLSEIRLSARTLGTLADFVQRKDVPQHDRRIEIRVEVAMQPVGSAGAALIDEQQVAFIEQRGELFSVVAAGQDRFLAGSTHQHCNRIGQRSSGRGGHDRDVNLQCALLRPRPIFGHLEHSAFCGTVEIGKLARGEFLGAAGGAPETTCGRHGEQI